MDEKTRQLVLGTLNLAHEAARRSILTQLDPLPPEERRAIEVCVQEFKSCVTHQFEGTMQPEAMEERITALIYGHSSSITIQVMDRYARTLNDLLCAARDRLTSTGKRRDN